MAITQADCARYAAAYQDAAHDAEHAHAAYRISMAARAEYDRHA